MKETIVSFAFHAYSFFLPVAWTGVAIVIFVLLPAACFRSTRVKAGQGIYAASWLFGITTWLLCVGITFAAWGWVGLFIGLILAGVGVVFLAILAAFITVKSVSMGFALIAMSIIVVGTRVAGLMLIARGEQNASPS